MELRDIVFEPHNDMSADDKDIVTQHDNLIKQNSYDNATAFLNSNNYKKGFRASMFNSIQNKMRKIEEYLLNEFVAGEDEYYKFTEPTDDEMEGKTWWIQPY